MTNETYDHESHERWDELAVGYAMSALEPDELDQFVRHLVARCPQCRQSVADTDDVGAAMNELLSRTEPRVNHRADVLAAAFAVRPPVPQTTADFERLTADFDAPPLQSVPVEASPRLEAVPPLAMPPIAAVPSPQDGASTVKDISGPRSGPRHLAPGAESDTGGADELGARRDRKAGRMSRRTGWLVAAASLVVAIALSVATISTVQARNAQNLADRRADVLSSITQGGSGRVVALRAIAGGSASATVVAHSDSVTVVPDGISPNSKANTYVLWGIASTTSPPVALGVFDVNNSHGAPTKVAENSAGYSGYATFAISEEPGRTAPAQPTKIVSAGRA